MSDLDAVDETVTPLSGDAGAMLTPLSASGPSVRALMLRKLADIVVLPSGLISSNERSLVADILLQVLDKVEPSMRAELARRVALVAECPPALARMLMLDEPMVAEEIIEGADHLPEALLIEAAREGAMAHRMMIARRIDLSTAIADACLAYEEMDVCKLVLKRDECLLSPGAINKLVALSAVNAELQALLLRRRELEPAHGFLMFWWVDGERRRRILTRFALDRSVVQDALADLYPRVFRGGEPDAVVKDILVLAERRHRPRGVNGEPVSMDIVKRTLAAACRYPSQEVIDAIAMIGGVSRDLAGRIVRDNGREPMAILCKSLGVPRDEFYEFYAKAGDGGETEQEAERLLAIFDSMARDFARAVLRYWDWDANPRIAHITRLMTKVQDEIGIQSINDLRAFDEDIQL